MQVVRVLLVALLFVGAALATETDSEAVAVASVDAESESAIDVDADVQAQLEAETEAEDSADADSEIDSEAVAEAEAEAEAGPPDVGNSRQRGRIPVLRGKKIKPHMHGVGDLRIRVNAFPVGYDQNSFRSDIVYADGGRPLSTEQLFAKHPRADRRVQADLTHDYAARVSEPYPYETPEYMGVDPRHPPIHYHKQRAVSNARRAHAAASKHANSVRKALHAAQKTAKTAKSHANLGDIRRLEAALAVALKKVGEHEARLNQLEKFEKKASDVVYGLSKTVAQNAAGAAAAVKAAAGAATVVASTVVQAAPSKPSKVLKASTPSAAKPAVGAKGVDISNPLSVNTAKCFRQNQIEWIVIRAGRTTGRPDANAPASIRSAIAAGFSPSQIGVYIFPLSSGSDPAAGGRQVKAMWDSLKSVQSQFSSIWLDIEKAKWSTTANNRKFFESMVAACKATGKQCGVYTSAAYWPVYMGKDYKGGASLPLWVCRGLWDRLSRLCRLFVSCIFLMMM